MSGQDKNAIQTNLVAMGFQPNYIGRAFKVYEKNYGHNYNIEVITEIIVRLQNKDKLKKKKNGDKGKSPQPQSKASQSKSKQSKQSNSANSTNNKPKTSKSKPKSSPNKPTKAKQSKPVQSDQSKPKNNKKDKHQSQVNINMAAHPKQSKTKQSNPIKAESQSPPQAFSGPNYGQPKANHNNIGNMGGINRQHSGGNKKQRKPAKPPSTNPLSQQSNMPQSQNSYNGNRHNSSKSPVSSPYKHNMQRGSPNPPPQRFTKNEVVLYNGTEAEVMNYNAQSGLYEITYPMNVYIMQRQSKHVAPNHLSKKAKGNYAAPPQRANQNHAHAHGQYNNNSNMYNQSQTGHSQRLNRHQYSQSGLAHNNAHNTHMSQQSNIPQTQMKQSHSHTQQNKGNKSSHTRPPKPQPPTTQNKTVKTVKTVKPEIDHNMPEFVSHMNLEQCNRLAIHDKIDHRDQVGRFVYATVSEKQGTNLKIHYDGWSRKWDTWSDFGLEMHRFAQPGGISKRPAHQFRQLKKGDYVDINPTQRHPGWKCGEIRRLDQKSGQVQVVYESVEKNYLYWAHLDNVHEIAEFTSKSGTVHQTQMDIIKKANPNNPNAAAQQSPQSQSQADKGRQDQIQSQQEPMDELEAFQRIRAKRFPRYPNEPIQNKYNIGDWLEVQDTQTHQWITATVIDKENNWIVVHFDGWPSKYDQKIHALKHKLRLRDLGSGLQETQEEKDIREEMASFLKEVESLSWQLIEVDADGNCLYRCFAINIYDDTTQHMHVRKECCQYMRGNDAFFKNFIPDFEQRMLEKDTEYEWGDHVDITALSELYNVRVRVFEYDKSNGRLYMSFDQGEHEETVNLPLVLLARHRKKHYNIIIDPQAVHKRPLKTAAERKDKISLKELRLKEDAKEECKEESEEKDGANEPAMNGGMGGMSMNENQMLLMQNQMSLRNIQSGLSVGGSALRNIGGKAIVLEKDEFIDVLETWNVSEPLQGHELKNIFQSLVNKIYKRIEFLITQSAQSHTFAPYLDKDTLGRYWKQQFEIQPQCDNNCQKWINALKEKIPKQQYPSNACLSSFNQVIVAPICDNLGVILDSSRKRQSTIDVSRQQQQRHAQQPMDIDK